ncbi:N5-carboxyaminoimidazole ribonucleotide mutase [Candidatus Kinetoplastibacterium sorsogonicusi]|uniref:N5-carboxyaminoimidazole ribonucleotide mutase n=1 Tax=Candidatus Kinetoplastidibacterium kentomonadis TaxID=1576550 RepID=A0A3Q8EWR8_9PROT|nr:5-(carboxyamino)imidazole ribonucleotide mutase [Candidatus Kinetoplastibacterium sorsogonicusi]AWD32269.1 N5-carboxyaminoimidazole ribonucleotide mutase [Candidatus Kinetoplastibacterium sorsogonicusi]
MSNDKVHNPIVGVVMGSSSDWEIMKHATIILEKFSIPFKAEVLSAHRMPDDMFDYSHKAYNRGLRAIIAGAGGAAHLPGMIASMTDVPVFGVPIPSKYLNGQDSLLSIVQMPKGIPVATFAIGESGAYNAALHVIAFFSMNNEKIRNELLNFRNEQSEIARNMKVQL